MKKKKSVEMALVCAMLLPYAGAASLQPDLPYAGGVGTGIVGGDAAMADEVGTGFGEGVDIVGLPGTEQLIAVDYDDGDGDGDDDAPEPPTTVGDLLLEAELAPPLGAEGAEEGKQAEDFDDFMDWLEENWGKDAAEWDDELVDLLVEGHAGWAVHHTDWLESAAALHEETMASHLEWLDEVSLAGLAAANPLADIVAAQQALFIDRPFGANGGDDGDGDGDEGGDGEERPLSPADFHASMFRRQMDRHDDWRKGTEELNAAWVQAAQESALLYAPIG